VVQSGASNLHYAKISSALAIPPESDKDFERSDRERLLATSIFSEAVNLIDGGEIQPMARRFLEVAAKEVGITFERAKAVALMLHQEEVADSGAGGEESDIEYGEYLAFLAEPNDKKDGDFATEHVTLDGSEVAVASLVESTNGLITRVVKAIKLREVRALTGFTRLEPGGDDVTIITPSLGVPSAWLPAVEIYGEGIFLRFDEAAINSWENDPAVVNKLAETHRLWQESQSAWLPEPTPRFVALHTLAHLLIRQLTFECGYSSASLREKIYSASPEQGKAMAGILIYTAAGDAEGSLGGLVRQAEHPRLIRTLASAVSKASWCSSDPVCSEVRSGTKGLNTGACHACSLVAETSCTSGNLLLDRALVTGGNQVPGLFEKLLEATLSIQSP